MQKSLSIKSKNSENFSSLKYSKSIFSLNNNFSTVSKSFLLFYVSNFTKKLILNYLLRIMSKISLSRPVKSNTNPFISTSVFCTLYTSKSSIKDIGIFYFVST